MEDHSLLFWLFIIVVQWLKCYIAGNLLILRQTRDIVLLLLPLLSNRTGLSCNIDFNHVIHQLG